MTRREVSGHDSRPHDFHDAEGGALSYRSALLARRHTAFKEALDSAETALARGAGDEALQVAVQAGLLEPDDARVIAILDQAQDALGADPSALPPTPVSRQPPRGRAIGPASWSIGTPSVVTPRGASGLISVLVTVVGHGLAIAVAFVLLAQVVPAINLTHLQILQLPAALVDNSAPPEVLETAPSDESEFSEEPATPEIVATTTLSELPVELGLVGTGRRTRMASFRRARVSGGMELPPGVEAATAAGLVGDGQAQTEVDRPPRLQRAVPPVYPPAAFDRGLEGVMSVILQVVLNRDGRVEQTSVVQGVAELHQAAQDAVMQWEYSPAIRNGQRIPVIFTVSITFDFQ